MHIPSVVLATMFTFGYWGWGSSTKLLLEVTAAVENARGFAAPRFVDLRISRSVRAAGFRDRAFEKLAGPDRYLWMPALGNRAVRDHLEHEIIIDDPRAASALLDEVMDRATKHQRVIAFCACEVPGTAQHPRCHRRTVANLLLQEAKRRQVALEVCEWPGGIASRRTLNVSAPLFRRLAAHGSLPSPWPVAETAALPWGTRITANGDHRSLTFLSAAAKPLKGKLVIPQRAWDVDNTEAAFEEYIRGCGFAP